MNTGNKQMGEVSKDDWRNQLHFGASPGRTRYHITAHDLLGLSHSLVFPKHMTHFAQPYWNPLWPWKKALK
jgi:hypothetical protein